MDAYCFVIIRMKQVQMIVTNILREIWYQARPCLPGAIIRCPHGKDSACECVKRFDTDKNCLITKQHITTVKASSCELKQIKESNDIQKCNLLSQIIQSEENKKDEYIKQYESFYGLLL
ncbi:unnamed protein product [Adineta steineri]|uniref:Uncharacterized protein n=1 Tax=Adineta steineri TaxID=433720 RepID=A0A813Y9Z0_9BILA|nr:unnamed protein product [Adineta steineri]CAF4241434.1 unnamed protein product [Adineta steineri]